MDAIRAYRESELVADNPVHLVVLLYDQLLRDLQRAIDAVAKGDITARIRELDHALLVIGQLQGTINLAGGGEVARTLDSFYSVVRHNLLLAASGASLDLLEKQRQQILAVREAWLEVECQQTGAQPRAASPSTDTQKPEDTISRGTTEWKA
ncbi:MAG TPA: flagellar export chaperone FliS [Terriglobales bacterium]|nr:flagellar export chaperone FliS [Terriglobales bacterium]